MIHKALIADIQRASVHDGPGMRTTVFFKGCPLSCAWCHNPECISYRAETLFYPKKCIGCGECDKGCYSGARVVCGREMSAEELMAELVLDKEYYGTDGGVTFSGGEPMAQSEFLKEIISLCEAEGIGCGVETSMIYYDEDIFRKMSVVLADLKIWDSDIHKKYTGVGNEDIKANLVKLDTLGVPIIARTPVIPEIKQDIDRISAFMKQLKNVVRYELLPYHPLGNTKRSALGLAADGFSVPEAEYMKELEKYAYIR